MDVISFSPDQWFAKLRCTAELSALTGVKCDEGLADSSVSPDFWFPGTLAQQPSIGKGMVSFRNVTIESRNGLKVDSADSNSGLTIASESGASDSPVHAYNLNRFIVGTTKAPQLDRRCGRRLPAVAPWRANEAAAIKEITISDSKLVGAQDLNLRPPRPERIPLALSAL